MIHLAGYIFCGLSGFAFALNVLGIYRGIISVFEFAHNIAVEGIVLLGGLYFLTR